MTFDALQKRLFAAEADPALMQMAATEAIDYLAAKAERRVWPDQAVLAALDGFLPDLPEIGLPDTDVIRQLADIGGPATVPYNGRYFGFVTGGALPVSVAAKWIGAAWDQATALNVMSPVSAHLENLVQRQLADLLGLPEDTVTGFVSGSSMAILCGLAAGRWRLYERMGWDINARGLTEAPPLHLVAGTHAHATVKKAIALLGLGNDNVTLVESDDQGRIRADLVPELTDRTLLMLQAGNVNSGAFDDFATLCARASEARAWTHVDGAFGLWAAAAPGLAHLTRGMEMADSFSADGHKTLNTPYDNGLVLCRDEAALVGALQASGGYILYGRERDGMMYTPEMSRRARVIELWAALQSLGRRGVGTLVSGLCERAREFADGLKTAGFTILNDVVFNQVLLDCGDEARTKAIVAHVQKSGECWAGTGIWQGRTVVRLSVCSWMTTSEDIRCSVAAFVAAREATG